MKHELLYCREETNMNTALTVSVSVLEAWNSLPSDVRSALVALEMRRHKEEDKGSSTASFTSDTSESDGGSGTEKTDKSLEVIERDDARGTTTVLKPLERAPKNVFEFSKTLKQESTTVEKTSATLVTTKKTIITRTRGWRNVFSLPISYDVDIIPHGTILEPTNPQLLEATGSHPEGYNRRFAVIDEAIAQIHGDKIVAYFKAQGIELTTCILPGGESDKRPDAVDRLLDELCAYKLRRREPFLAIGGGVILDIAGMAACLYRRGVPFVRVPTTLLAIVDASVGVKNGVDYCCDLTNDTYKNRVGSFYAPSSCLLDSSFIQSQDERNICNGFGEILKLALVRSVDLFELLETHGKALVDSRFAPNSSVPEEVATRIIDLSIQIMLEELGPNLWEHKLERCVDYGHTFSKLLEMVPGADIMHGEAVNVDGFFCCVISFLRGYIPHETVDRVFKCMKSIGLPTNSADLDSELAWQSCKDAVEHRHGEQRIPLITDIGESICVSDITPEELDRALEVMKEFPH
jgi:3-dehydroquinate synthase